MEIVQAPDRLVMLFEYDVVYRIVYLDGRGHPEDAVPTWMGHSIGRWEGDTLVVHTANFNGKSWLDRVGHPYSEELQLTERIRRVGDDTLQVDITFHDPKTYTRDWTGQKMFRLQPTSRQAVSRDKAPISRSRQRKFPRRGTFLTISSQNIPARLKKSSGRTQNATTS